MNFNGLNKLEPKQDNTIYRSSSYDGKEKYKDLYTRVTDRAKELLSGMPNINPRMRERAFALMEDPIFRKKIKDGWDRDTLRGVVDPDPEKQDKLWANGLVQRISELPLLKEIN